MKILSNKGLSLVELLVSIVLISILLTVAATYFVNSSKQNSTITKNYDSIQLCRSLLDVYKGKDPSELEDILKNGTGTKTLGKNDIKAELGLTEELPFHAKVQVKEHPDSLLKNKIFIVTITVQSENGKKQTALEGYVRK